MTRQPTPVPPTPPPDPAGAPLAARDLNDAADARLRDILKRCSPATYEAALAFRRTGDLGFLPVVIHGIIERYVEREVRSRMVTADDNLRLVEDLGLDSLTRMEIVLLAEDVLPISIDNEDLCQLRTLGDVKQRMAERVAAFQAGAHSAAASTPPAPGIVPVVPSLSTQLFSAPRVPLTPR